MTKATTAFRKAPKLCGSVPKMLLTESGISPVSHSVNVFTTAANDRLTMKATAMSTRLPRRTKFLKPVMGHMLLRRPTPRDSQGERTARTLVGVGERQEPGDRRLGDVL